VTSNRTTRVDWGRSEHARLARPQRKKIGRGVPVVAAGRLRHDNSTSRDARRLLHCGTLVLTRPLRGHSRHSRYPGLPRERSVFWAARPPGGLPLSSARTKIVDLRSARERRRENPRSPYGFDTLRGMAEIPLDELEKAAWEEFKKWADDYIDQYTKAIDRVLRSRNRRPSQARAAADN
jgi:hypothetical protein